MKYEAKIENISVKSDYPINVERLKELVEQHAYSWTKQVIIESSLADKN